MKKKKWDTGIAGTKETEREIEYIFVQNRNINNLKYLFNFQSYTSTRRRSEARSNFALMDTPTAYTLDLLALNRKNDGFAPHIIIKDVTPL